ncbi:MAG: hypothetical protein N2512_11100, partial [Armatimonadetes bacterium]|nr:hypothetical protein [Armatimonadota bacterium]
MVGDPEDLEDLEDWEAREREVLEAEADAPASIRLRPATELPDAQAPGVPGSAGQEKPRFLEPLRCGQRTDEPQAPLPEEPATREEETEAIATPGPMAPPSSSEDAAGQEATCAETGLLESTNAQLAQARQPEEEVKPGDDLISCSRPRRRTFLDWFLGRASAQPEPGVTQEATDIVAEQSQAQSSELGLETPEEPSATAPPAEAVASAPCAEATPEEILAATSTEEMVKQEIIEAVADEVEKPTESLDQPLSHAQPGPAEEPEVGIQETASQPQEVAEPQESAPTDVHVSGKSAPSDGHVSGETAPPDLRVPEDSPPPDVHVPGESAPTDMHVPEESVEALARLGQRRALLDDLGTTGEAEVPEVEVRRAEEGLPERLQRPGHRPSRIARIGAGLALIVLAVATIKMHEAAQLRDFLSLPIAGRAV